MTPLKQKTSSETKLPDLDKTLTLEKYKPDMPLNGCVFQSLRESIHAKILFE